MKYKLETRKAFKARQRADELKKFGGKLKRSKTYKSEKTAKSPLAQVNYSQLNGRAYRL